VVAKDRRPPAVELEMAVAAMELEMAVAAVE
jgi:hypothetical protein